MTNAYRLTLLLPPAMLLLVPEGRHTPCLHGCVMVVDRGRVSIAGPSRDRVYDQARRMFLAHARRLPALQVAAVLETPAFAGSGARGRGGSSDGITIIVNSDVTFAPTGLDADIRPLRLVDAGDVAIAS